MTSLDYTPLLTKAVLVLTRTPGEEYWFPEYVGVVAAETKTFARVRRHWWSRGEWLPKCGPFSCIAETNG